MFKNQKVMLVDKVLREARILVSMRNDSERYILALHKSKYFAIEMVLGEVTKVVEYGKAKPKFADSLISNKSNEISN